MLNEMLDSPDREGDLGRLDGYRIIRVVGAGGMGVVFQAEDPNLQRHVAIKVMQPKLARNLEARQRFSREAMLTAAFEHEHVVTIYQVAETKQIPYFVMEWLQGESLGSRLRRQGRLTPAEALEIARQIALGLNAAHSQGLLHRDIKPDNIWLRDRDGHVKILDFGLVREHDDSVSLTASGVILGTPSYMAPEMATGQPVDRRADLFSLGCVMYHMLTGRPPIAGRNVVATLVAVAKGEIAVPHQVDPEIPISVSQLTMRLLATRPESRPEDASEAVRQIERAQSSLIQPRRTRSWKSLCVSAIAGATAAWLAAAAIFLVTARGTLVIEADDSTRLQIQGDALVVEDVQRGRSYAVEIGANSIRPGEYRIQVRDDSEGLEFSTSEFTIARNGVQVVRVALVGPAEEPAAKVSPPPIAQADGTTSSERVSSLQPDGENGAPSFLAVDALPTTINPGEPLSPVALVQKPTAADGLTSYTLEPTQHRGGITDATFTADGRYLLTAGVDGTVRIWDMPSRRLLHIIVCPGRVHRIALSRDGHRLATVQDGNQATIVIWNLLGEFGGQDWRAQMAIKIARKAEAASWSMDDQLLAFSDGAIQLLDTHEGRVLPNFGMKGTISRNAWSADGRFLAAEEVNGSDASIVIWDMKERKIHSTIKCQSASAPHWSGRGRYLAYSTAESPDPAATASGSENRIGSVAIWDVDRQQVVREISIGQCASRVPVRWSTDGSLIGALANEATTWNVKTGEPIDRKAIPSGQPGWQPGWPAGPVEWQPGTDQLLWLYQGMLWQTADWKPWLEFTDNRLTLFSGAGQTIVRRKWAETAELVDSTKPQHESGFAVDVWDATAKTHQISFSHAGRARAFLSPHGRYLIQIEPLSVQPVDAPGPRPGEKTTPATLRLFDVKERRTLGDVQVTVSSLTFDGNSWSPNDRYFAFESVGGQFTILDVLHPAEQLTIKSPRPLNRHFDRAPVIAWSPDSRAIAWPGDSKGILVSRIVDEHGNIPTGIVRPSDLAKIALLPFNESTPRVRDEDAILNYPQAVIWTESDVISVWQSSNNVDGIPDLWSPAGDLISAGTVYRRSPRGITGVAFPPPGATRQLMAVAHFGSVSIIDLTERQVTGQFELPENEIAVSAVFPHVPRVALNVQRQTRPLSIVNPDGGVVAEILASPHSTMAILGNGEVFTGDANTIQFWNADGNLIRNWILPSETSSDVIEIPADGISEQADQLYRIELRDGSQITLAPSD
ncbi:MAG: serine/threonine-protein kinase [Pirellulales bacterium]